MKPPEKIWLTVADNFITDDWEWTVWEKKPRHRVESAEYHLTPQWVSVEDRLPEDVGHYLSCDNKYAGSVQVRLFNPNEYEGNHGYEDKFGYNVTHWMPLPAPPEDV